MNNKLPAQVLLAGCIFILSVAVLAAERVDEKTFPVDKDATFSLNMNRGMITIRTDDVDTIRIVTTISHEDEDALDLVRIDTSNSNRRVRVRVKYNDIDVPWWSWRDGSPYPEVDMDIVVPANISLDIESNRSDMDIEAPGGEIRINSNRGQGEVTGIKSDFELETNRGDFDLEITELHDLDINTGRGDVYATIEKADDFRIRGESNRGRLNFRGRDIRSTREGRGEYVSERIGDGSNLVFLDTNRGDITLTFED